MEGAGRMMVDRGCRNDGGVGGRNDGKVGGRMMLYGGRRKGGVWRWQEGWWCIEVVGRTVVYRGGRKDGGL